MKSILEELWYGNICPNSGCREETKEVNKLMGYIDDHHEALLGMLTNKQRKRLCPSLSISSVEGALRKLVAEGELKREGNGKNTCYYRLK